MIMARESAADREAREAQERADAALAEAASDAPPVDDEGDKGKRVRVPESTGDTVTFTKGVDVVRTFRVSDGLISPKNDDERALLLAHVPGAQLVD